MVRTKADGGRKAVAAKAPRKALATTSSASSSSPMSPSANKYAGGNPYCPRPTPDWQKGIGSFFQKPEGSKDKENTEPQINSEGSSATSSQGSSSSCVETTAEITPSPRGSPVKASPIDDYSDED